MVKIPTSPPCSLIESVKTYDRDRYLATLFAPQEKRPHLFALYAFNVELARISEIVHEPMIGAIRLEWWREALACRLGEKTSGHPVCEAFSKTMAVCELSADHIETLIAARHFDVSAEPMTDWTTLKKYLHETAGVLFSLSMEIMAKDLKESHLPNRDQALDELIEEAAQKAGLAYGLTGLMRALPVHCSTGRLFLPRDYLAAYGVDISTLYEGRETEALNQALKDLRMEAAQTLREVLQMIPKFPPFARKALRPLVLVQPFLSALDARAHRPLHQIADIHPLRRLFLLWHGL